MGHIDKDAIIEYWSTDELTETPIFRKIMSRDRYISIVKYQHFADNSMAPNREDPNYDRLRKIRKIFDTLNNSYKEAYNPTEEVAIDEIIVKFKGRVLFRQYIPKKHKRWGMKIYKICDKIGYTYHMQMYLGKEKDKENPSQPVSHALVMKMTTCIEGKGHKLFMDNYFSSPNLFKELLEKRRINSCGTVRPNRKNFPKFTEKSVRGKICVKFSEGMTALRWTDKRDVFMLSNMHLPPTNYLSTQKNDEENKPEIVQVYNTHMGYVDLSDRMSNTYTFGRRTLKWTKKLFFHLLDLSILNAYCLYKLENPDATHKNFRMALIRDILSSTEISCGSLASPSTSKRHYLEMDPTDHWPSKVQKKRRRCVVCQSRGKERRTSVLCIKCNIGLCIKDCFRDFHCVMYLPK